MLEPIVVGTPATSKRSLIPRGTPCSGPRQPRAQPSARLYLESAAGWMSLVALAGFGHLETRRAGDERFGDQAGLRVVVDDGSEWTAVANQAQTLGVGAFDFGQRAQRAEHARRGLQTLARAPLRDRQTVSQPLADLAHRRGQVFGWRAFLQDGQQLAENGRVSLWKQ